MKIAIIGAGSVGLTLAKRIDESGKFASVVIGTRHIRKAQVAQQQWSINLSCLPVKEAVSVSDAIILAISCQHDDKDITKFAHSLGNCSGKIIVDATNPLDNQQEVRWKQVVSCGELLAQLLPSSRVFKAFNTVGVEHMRDPIGKDMFYCGSQEARKEAEEIIRAVGFSPFYVGPIRYARNLEAMAELYIHIGSHMWGRSWTFGVRSI